MKPVKMHEAKTNFSKLITLVEGGAEIVVQRGDVPVARIVPYVSASRPRKAGALKGRITLADDFDELPEGFSDYVA
jgi:antitoxin (DNA-binding transcriptional repressor) of toxin-antitoxin stability system